ncbi:hypothetical protein SARC_00389 [Sphaeroforma arctica JP610]|uniref:Uncharacterized protein n=1 Tax=Sphaeroforma arctica JP610 TaxID=667725 RepID=A0A0L0GF58_9EUKA|nr:hypothetical protein SARC_00389 [Sphaeroforma arctica JP610]KNC87504.1 hypothetical protein SARC_00389 [Sphaeroforma arctica JP610]|eukprot:XP_014161406.1 hypothetical protein SARC_00389 [Sphaeroforma arctica JP610]
MASQLLHKRLGFTVTRRDIPRIIQSNFQRSLGPIGKYVLRTSASYTRPIVGKLSNKSLLLEVKGSGSKEEMVDVLWWQRRCFSASHEGHVEQPAPGLSTASLRRELQAFANDDTNSSHKYTVAPGMYSNSFTECGRVRVCYGEDFSLNAYNAIAKGQKMLATDSDIFQFSCTGCGGCCRSYSNNIMLDPHDVFLVSRSPKFDVHRSSCADDETTLSLTTKHSTNETTPERKGEGRGRRNKHARRRDTSKATASTHSTRERMGKTRRLMMEWGDAFERRSGVFSDSTDGGGGSVPLLYLKPRVVTKEKREAPGDVHTPHTGNVHNQAQKTHQYDDVQESPHKSAVVDGESSSSGWDDIRREEVSATDNVICRFAVQVPVSAEPLDKTFTPPTHTSNTRLSDRDEIQSTSATHSGEHDGKRPDTTLTSNKGWRCSLGASHMPSSCALYPLGEFVSVTTDSRGRSVISDVTGSGHGDSALLNLYLDDDSDIGVLENEAEAQKSHAHHGDFEEESGDGNINDYIDDERRRIGDDPNEWGARGRAALGKTGTGARQNFYTIDTQFCEGVQNVSQLSRNQHHAADDADEHDNAQAAQNTKAAHGNNINTPLSDYLKRNTILDRRREWDWFRHALAHFAEMDEKYMQVVLTPSSTRNVDMPSSRRDNVVSMSGQSPLPTVATINADDSIDKYGNSVETITPEELEHKEALDSLMMQFQGAVQDVLANAWYDFDSYQYNELIEPDNSEVEYSVSTDRSSYEISDIRTHITTDEGFKSSIKTNLKAGADGQSTAEPDFKQATQKTEWLAVRTKIFARTKALSHLLQHGLQSLERVRESHEKEYNAMQAYLGLQDRESTSVRSRAQSRKSRKVGKKKRKSESRNGQDAPMSKYLSVEAVANELDDILGRLSELP